MSIRKRLWPRLLAGAAGVLALAVTGCASAAGGGGGAAAGSGPLVIGASVSLTGDFADSGAAVERGYQLWADTVNAHGGLLGRKVQIKIVDDLSSPSQVISNYENLISQSHVGLLFGPFSSLLTVPASQVAKRYGYAFLEPAGGGPSVFAQKLPNLFFVQPAASVQSGDVFANWVLSLPPAERPKTPAYAELDDPFSAPIAESIRAKFEAAGIKTVFKQVYPAETQDLSPVMAGVAAAHPDDLVGGTQSQDAYAQVNALLHLPSSPHVVYLSNAPNSPQQSPTQHAPST